MVYGLGSRAYCQLKGLWRRGYDLGLGFAVAIHELSGAQYRPGYTKVLFARTLGLDTSFVVFCML